MKQKAFDLLPKDKQKIVQRLILSLSQIKGVKAIALGGSYVRGTAKPGSDVDLGLYYSDDDPLDISAIQKFVKEITPENKPVVVTNLYEWGTWVNGGAWIETESGKIDLLYRSLEHIQRVIQDSCEGKFLSDFLQQPPYGFYSVTYLGETKTCIPIFDPQQHIQVLKDKIALYPSALKQTIIQDSLWSVEFTLLYAKKCARENGLYTTAGCITRMLSCLVQVLFALNEEYFISDREAMNAVEHFPIRPEEYTQKVNSIFDNLKSDADLVKSIQELEKLFQSIKQLAGSQYVPKYQIG